MDGLLSENLLCSAHLSRSNPKTSHHPAHPVTQHLSFTFSIFFPLCFGDTLGGAEITPHSVLRDLALLAGSEDYDGMPEINPRSAVYKANRILSL